MAGDVLPVALCLLAAVVVMTVAAARAWTQYVTLRRQEIDATLRQHSQNGALPWIDLADLKERVRSLEARVGERRTH